MPKIIIYTTPTCGYCKFAKEFFREHNVSWEEKNVAADLAARHEMIAKSNQLGVPVIDIDGAIVVGFDKKKIAELIGANNI